MFSNVYLFEYTRNSKACTHSLELLFILFFSTHHSLLIRLKRKLNSHCKCCFFLCIQSVSCTCKHIQTDDDISSLKFLSHKIQTFCSNDIPFWVFLPFFIYRCTHFTVHKINQNDCKWIQKHFQLTSTQMYNKIKTKKKFFKDFSIFSFFLFSSCPPIRMDKFYKKVFIVK